MATGLILGEFALDPRCTKGDHLANITSANRPVVSRTRFQQPQRQLVTWLFQGRTYQEPGRPHASTVPMGLLHDRLQGLQ